MTAHGPKEEANPNPAQSAFGLRPAEATDYVTRIAHPLQQIRTALADQARALRRREIGAAEYHSQRIQGQIEAIEYNIARALAALTVEVPAARTEAAPSRQIRRPASPEPF